MAVVSATEKYLSRPQHRKLFDSVAQLFLVHHKVQLPYRIPVKVPLLSPQLKMQLTSVIHGVIDRQSVWPSHLNTYLKSRVQLIRAKTSTVSDCLLKNPLQYLPTTALTANESGPCPCHAWAHLTNVHMWDGHIVFRDPAVLKVMERKIDPSVFSQNSKNAAVPSWKGFVKSLNLLPCFIVPSILDKSPQTPISVCARFWTSAYYKTFLSSPRYEEVLRFADRNDAGISCLWHLTDSMCMSVFGQPSRFSKLMGASPLSPAEQQSAFALSVKHRASRALKNRISTILDARCDKLKKWLSPQCSQDTLSAFSTHALVPLPELKRLCKARCPASARKTPTVTRPLIDQRMRPSRPVCTPPQYSKPLPVPKCKLIPKHKWREDVPGSKLKVREVIDHSGQPFKSVCRHLGRCLTLLWKHVCSKPEALESVSMENLHSFVLNLSHLEVSRDAEWVELDLMEMFPNVPRDKVLTAVQHFWSTMCQEKHLNKESSGFRIHKPGL